MSSISTIKSLIVPNKTVEVEFPGMPGFKIQLCYLSREALLGIRKKATKVTFKNRQTSEDFDEETFLKLYVGQTIKGWKGLTLAYLEQLVPVDMGDADPSTEVDFSTENALDLMKNSTNFDAFITEQVTDLGNFSKTTQKS